MLQPLNGQMFGKKLSGGRRYQWMVVEIQQVIKKWHKKTAPCCGAVIVPQIGIGQPILN